MASLIQFGPQGAATGRCGGFADLHQLQKQRFHFRFVRLGQALVNLIGGVRYCAFQLAHGFVILMAQRRGRLGFPQPLQYEFHQGQMAGLSVHGFDDPLRQARLKTDVQQGGGLGDGLLQFIPIHRAECD